MFASRICLYFVEFILQSTCGMFSVPMAVIRQNNMTDSPLCLKVAQIFFSGNGASLFLQTYIYFKGVSLLYIKVISPQPLLPKHVRL